MYVVDVSILVRMADDIKTWNVFGTYLPNEFKKYINME